MTVLYERSYHEGTLGETFICDGGELGNLTVPVSFTDRGREPESQPLTVEALVELAEIISVIQQQPAGPRVDGMQ